MTLYHNCDYRDLPSILKDGILPMSKTGNNRWEDKKRVNNSEDVVYLFKPVGKQNSFTQYGICLIEVETDATENVLDEADVKKKLRTNSTGTFPLLQADGERKII